LSPSSLQQNKKQEGDDSFVVIAFFIATKPKKEGLKGGSLFSSSRFGLSVLAPVSITLSWVLLQAFLSFGNGVSAK